MDHPRWTPTGGSTFAVAARPINLARPTRSAPSIRLIVLPCAARPRRSPVTWLNVSAPMEHRPWTRTEKSTFADVDQRGKNARLTRTVWWSGAMRGRCAVLGIRRATVARFRFVRMAKRQRWTGAGANTFAAVVRYIGSAREGRGVWWTRRPTRKQQCAVLFNSFVAIV